MMCRFKGCPNEADFLILRVCRTCYSGLRYWEGRSRADKRSRQDQLVKLTSRMRYMVEANQPLARNKRR